MHTRYTLSLFAALTLLGTFGSVAQTDSIPSHQSAKATQEVERPKLLATQLRYRGPISIGAPILSDSLDVHARPFDLASSTASLISLSPESNIYRTIGANVHGVFDTPTKPFASKQELQAHLYGFYLLSGSYAKGKVSIECDAPWELYHNGKKIGSGQGKALADTVAPTRLPITLEPERHTLLLKVQPNQEQASKAISLRAGFTPERPDADIRLLTEPTRYPDLNYMIYGSTLSGVRISPSGRYSILYLTEPVSGKPSLHRAYLYRGNKRIGELSGMAARAQWLPKQDRLYFDEASAQGRSLYYLDPTTMMRELICRQIPEGHYMVSPSETALIFFPEDKGPEYKKTLDRFVSADDRIKGFRNRSFLAIFDLETETYRRLTFGSRPTMLQDIASDDSKLIYSVPTPTPTKSPFMKSDFYELDLQMMSIDTLFAGTTDISSLRYTSDPRYIVAKGSASSFDYIGCVLPKGSAINSFDEQLFLYDRTLQSARPLTKSLDRSIASVQVPRDRFEVYCLAEVGDERAIYQIDLASGRTTRLSHREEVVKSFTVSRRGQELVYVGQSALNSDRFYTVDTKRGKEQLVYDFAAEKMQHLETGTVKDWDWTAPDGTRIEGRYYLPHGFDPKKKYPMLVYYYGGTSPVHRGFEGAYSLSMYASLGYVVYSLNPSGATGYGQEFAARHINAWGKRTADEIIGAVKDFCKAHTFVNDKKIGCMGASYGGFMTQYLQTQTDIFAAAVSHAGISAIASYWGEGFWGVGYSTIASKDSYPWNNPKLYTEQSPLYLADKIHTPLLLIHGLSDTNVPVGESWQMFNALRILGRPVEFVGVYGEDHHILDPQKRYEWSSAIMAFFAKYLQDNPTWWDDLFPKTGI
ncbi:MAG: prolyl oligopeptidase family serine peptidase [Porphyromonadaceae bacterium]|nr:prolyl oligopeptidase family serine peptidase [Porphyromonadaceae bacterium]